MLKIANFLLPLSVAVGACTQLGTEGVPAERLVPNGYYCTTTPSEAYSPGYVYRIDGGGAEFLVDVLSDQAETFSFRAALGTYKANVSRGVDLDISLLDDSAVPGASATISAGTTNVSSVSFSDGKFILMNDAGFRTIAQLALDGLQPEAESTYFVVRDSIQAKGIDISLTVDNEFSLGGESEISKLLSAKPNIKLERGEGLIIKGTFAEPLNVCIRAVRIDPVQSDDRVSEGRNWSVTSIAATSAQSAAIIQSK
ncbi:hypothetical protein ACVDG3_21845 [Meridianimarinicoccus sp. RP-17]|uniref:hypothetical protein n=1 Tax=Meridianimarinicoccus zhengii TaxID=2056810 RepID=UPI000DABA6A1|nr:hypothetical protein [Phycocomes zhengii]